MNKTKNKEIKLVLLGDSNVGKTSILNRWISGKFQENYKPTIGTCNIRKTIRINEEDIELFIWDTAGQEVYHSFLPLYTRNSLGFIIVGSFNDEQSIKNIENWIQIAEESSEFEIPKILLLNKMDLIEFNDPQIEMIQNKYQRNFNGIFNTSAKTGLGILEGIDFLAFNSFKLINKIDKPKENTTLFLTKKNNENNCCD